MLPQRGEVWWVELDPTRGSEIQKTRPAVVISAKALAWIPVRIIVPITSWQPHFASRPTMVFLEATVQNGLTNDSAADALQVRSVATERLTQRLGVITADQLADVVAGVALCIDY